MSNLRLFALGLGSAFFAPLFGPPSEDDYWRALIVWICAGIVLAPKR